MALKSEFPRSEPPVGYKIGIGDAITFSRLIENNRVTRQIASEWPIQQITSNYKLGIGDTVALTLMKDDNASNQMAPISRGNPNGDNDYQNFIINPQQSESTITTTGRIGSDGSVLLLEVGRLEANGKSLNELRSEVRNNLIRNGISPRFQLEIVEFKSKKAYLTINSNSTVVILDDQRKTIKDILTSAAVGFTPGVITRIRLQRDRKEYSMLLRDVYKEDAPGIDVKTGDHIFVEDSSANIVSSSSIVDGEGNLVFEGVGELKALGRSLSDLRVEIESLMQQVPDSQNAFQVQITNFASQKALLTVQGTPGVLVPITDTPAKLTEVLMQNGMSTKPDTITQIRLQRDGRTYEFSLDDLLALGGPDIYLQPEDHISSQVLPYKENKVFIMEGRRVSILE